MTCCSVILLFHTTKSQHWSNTATPWSHMAQGNSQATKEMWHRWMSWGSRSGKIPRRLRRPQIIDTEVTLLQKKCSNISQHEITYNCCQIMVIYIHINSWIFSTLYRVVSLYLLPLLNLHMYPYNGEYSQMGFHNDTWDPSWTRWHMSLFDLKGVSMKRMITSLCLESCVLQSKRRQVAPSNVIRNKISHKCPMQRVFTPCRQYVLARCLLNQLIKACILMYIC